MISNRIVTLALSVLLVADACRSQTVAAADSEQSDDSFWTRRNTSKIAVVGLAGGTLAYSAGVWWINDYRPFYFTQGDWFTDKLGIDKIGHMYTSYFMFHALNDILLWGGHGESASFWWAAGIAAFHGAVVEVGDGLSHFGFDYKDLTFNYIGLSYGMLQEQVPALRNFEIKWSLYYPLNRHPFKVNALYDYHIYWMSARIHELLPAGLSTYWPPFLQIAFGLGADGNLGWRTYVLSFDYNLELIPIEGQDASLLKRILNMIHLPAPGVKFAPGHHPVFQLLLLN